MKATALLGPGDLRIITAPEPQLVEQTLLLRVEMVGEIAATVLEGSKTIPSGIRATVSPYTSCGRCASCRKGRVNACEKNQTLGVKRDGALTELIRLPESEVFPSKLFLRELCFIEPLT